MAESALTIPRAALPRFAAGAPNVALAELGQPPLAQQAGRPLELLAPDGAFLGRGLADPENGVLRILSRSAEEPLDDRFLRRRAERALELRLRLGLIPADGRVGGAFRLINGEGDGLGGVLSEVYGPYVIQYVYARGLKDWGRRLAQALAEAAAALGLRCADEDGAGGDPWPRGILQKLRAKDSARPGKPSQDVVHGREPPEALLVREGAMRFEVHPLAGLNVGLFTDMREHRARLGRYARGARVLNAFAYTGSLSVAAALGGARELTSVDLSSGVLKWARENFRHSGLDPERHRFEVEDVGRFLARAVKDDRERWDLVIIDPPTYSAARAAAWSLKNDLESLVRSAMEVLEPGGILWFAANSHQISGAELEAGLAAGAAAAGREVVVLERGGLPPDAPVLPGWTEGDYLKLRVLRGM